MAWHETNQVLLGQQLLKHDLLDTSLQLLQLSRTAMNSQICTINGNVYETNGACSCYSCCHCVRVSLTENKILNNGANNEDELVRLSSSNLVSFLSFLLQKLSRKRKY